jgi:hypothetical protein
MKTPLIIALTATWLFTVSPLYAQTAEERPEATTPTEEVAPEATPEVTPEATPEVTPAPDVADAAPAEAEEEKTTPTIADAPNEVSPDPVDEVTLEPEQAAAQPEPVAPADSFGSVRLLGGRMLIQSSDAERLGTTQGLVGLQLTLEGGGWLEGFELVAGGHVSDSSTNQSSLRVLGAEAGVRWLGPQLLNLNPTLYAATTLHSIKPDLEGIEGESALAFGLVSTAGLSYETTLGGGQTYVIMFEAGYSVTPSTTLRLAGQSANVEDDVLEVPAVRIGEFSQSGLLVRAGIGMIF